MQQCSLVDLLKEARTQLLVNFESGPQYLPGNVAVQQRITAVTQINPRKIRVNPRLKFVAR